LDAAAASTRPGRRAARNDRQPASAERADTGKEPGAADEGGGTHETLAGARRPNRTRQARRPTMKAAVRDLTPEIKTEFRKALDKALPKDPELRAKIIAIYSQNPLLKRFYEEAGFEVTYDYSRR
jgi:hypothetical protein